MIKIAIFYPYATGENAFSGGVAKVVISNIITCINSGMKPFLILPIDNSGLIIYVRKNYPQCQIYKVNFQTLALFSDTTGVLKYFKIFSILFKYIIGLVYIKLAFLKIKPDIIHFHEVINFPLFILCKKSIIILHLHSYRFTQYKSILKIILFFLNNYANLIISPTKSIANEISNELKPPIEILKTPFLKILNNNSINLNDNLHRNNFINIKSNNKIIFAFIGRISRIKRIDHFLIAISKLPPELKNKINFSIIGGPNDEGDEKYLFELRKLSTSLGLDKILVFHGYINPIDDILDLIDYGVILSESEAIPMVGVEYMKYNIPIVGYDAPGINDFLVDEYNGYLLFNGSISNLVSKIIFILDDNIIKPKFNDLIPTIYNSYNIDSFSNSLSHIYSKLLVNKNA